jgi:FAD:protein FMN transferase
MRARIALALALLIGSAACGGGSHPDGDRFEGEAMGTTYLVRLAEGVSESERRVVARTIEDALEDVDSKMSNYRPDSEISRFNEAQAGVPVPISRETFDVVTEAARVSELTGGAFDVTVAPLVRLWGFGPGSSSPTEPPSEEAIAKAKSRVGYGRLDLDDDSLTLTKEAPYVECDLSAIAKGYAVDRVAEALEARGYGDYMVEVGGEVRTLGKNAGGEAWRLGIEKPLPGTRDVQRIVTLSGLSLATSGDYRNFHELGGKLRSHLIDPRNGRPVEHQLASVSVVDQTCMTADALASGLLVLGPEAGYELAVAKDLSVLFLIRTEDGKVEERATPAFAQLFY